MFQTTLCKRRMPPICVSVYHLIVQALFVSRKWNNYERNWNSTGNEVTHNIKIKMLNENNYLNNTKFNNTVQGRNKTLPHGNKMEINDNLSHKWKTRMEINDSLSLNFINHPTCILWFFLCVFWFIYRSRVFKVITFL